LWVDDRDGPRLLGRAGSARMVISERIYLVIVAMLAAERMFELWLSHRNAQRAFARGGIEAGQMHYRAMAAMHTLFLVSCAAESFFFAREVSPLISTIALIGAIVSQTLRYAAVAALGDRWNTRVIVMPGAQPITRGVYRWIRHPNYVAVVIEIA